MRGKFELIATSFVENVLNNKTGSVKQNAKAVIIYFF
ncbi:MAG: hypothetical protein ACJAVD_000665 [Porticoccaceae bacterium]